MRSLVLFSLTNSVFNLLLQDSVEETNILGERSVLYCVSMPAESEWSKQQANAQLLESKEKEQVQQVKKKPNSSKKRQRNQHDQDEPIENEVLVVEEENVEQLPIVQDAKKQKAELPIEQEKQQATPSFIVQQSNYYPIPGASHLACIVKIYLKDAVDIQENIKICDLVEFVGILCEPEAPVEYEDTGFMEK